MIGVVWVAAALAWSWTQRQYYIGEQDGVVVIFRGINADLPGIDLSEAYQSTDVEVDRLPELDADRVHETIEVDDLDAAEAAVQELAELQEPEAAAP